MRTYLDCLPCFVGQALDVTRLIGANEELSERILRDVLQTASRMDYSQPPPVMGKYIHYEALSHTEKDAFFLLKAKCSVVAADLGCTAGTMMLTRSGGRGNEGDPG